MKKIINNCKYDTNTAELICVVDNGYPTFDFYYKRECLYKKVTGELFLHGQGGAASPYSRSSGNSYYWSEKIIPLQEKEAMQWLETNGTVEEYELLFGKVFE